MKGGHLLADKMRQSAYATSSCTTWLHPLIHLILVTIAVMNSPTDIGGRRGDDFMRSQKKYEYATH